MKLLELFEEIIYDKSFKSSHSYEKELKAILKNPSYGEITRLLQLARKELRHLKITNFENFYRFSYAVRSKDLYMGYSFSYTHKTLKTKIKIKGMIIDGYVNRNEFRIRDNIFGSESFTSEELKTYNKELLNRIKKINPSYKESEDLGW